MRILAHHFGNIRSQFAQHKRVIPADAELHREANRRAVRQTRHMRQHLREFLGKQTSQLAQQAFAAFGRLGGHHDLHIMRRRRRLIHHQYKTGPGRTDVRDHIVDILILGQQLFQLLHLCQRRFFR